MYAKGRDIHGRRRRGKGKGCKIIRSRKKFFMRKSHRGRRSVHLRRLGNWGHCDRVSWLNRRRRSMNM